MADDLPVDYNPLRITVTPGPITNVPAGLPVQYNDIDPLTGNPIPSAPDLSGPDKLAGFVPWWQRMAVSGATAPGDAYAGLLPVESPTGYPGSISPGSNDVQMEPRALPKLLGMGNFTVPSSESEIARVQDTAGMAGMSGIGMTPKGALGTAGSKAVKDFYGNELTNYHGNPISVGEDGKLTLYHRTNEQSKNEIVNSGKFKSKENTNETFFSDNLESEYGKGFGDNVVAVKIDPKYVRLNDQFPNGENHYAVSNKHLSKANILLEDTRAATGIGAINQSGFYSNLERTIANSKVDKATPEQWTSYLKNQPGIKSEELEFGLGNLPDKMLTKNELAEHIAENGVKLGEVWKGKPKEAEFVKAKELSRGPGQFDNVWEVIDRNGNGQRIDGVRTEQDAIRQANETYSVNNNAPKYSSYQLPGGDNYRELLLTVPEKISNDLRYMKEIGIEKDLHTAEDVQYAKSYNSNFRETFKNHTDKEVLKLAEKARNISSIQEPYKSSHWDEPNVLAHIRMNDRDIPGVGKTLHIEEIQSDFLQAHRKEALKIKDAINKDFDTIADRMIQAGVIKKICD